MKERIRKSIEFLTGKANFCLRKDVRKLLAAAYSRETNKKAKQSLSWILENATIAEKEKLAICQDTGLPIIFIEIGDGAFIRDSFVKSVEDAVSGGYKKYYFRPSLVHPLKREFPSHKGVLTHIVFSKGLKGIKVTVFPKGFGSENKAQLKMFNPTAQIKDIENFVIECVKKAGPESCPPFIVGVGIGGTSDHALLLAKKALIGRVDKPNKDKFLNRIEKKFLNRINSLNIGPMGMGGKCTALALKIETTSTHIAGLPVGVNISCHALRSASLNLDRLDNL